MTPNWSLKLRYMLKRVALFRWIFRNARLLLIPQYRQDGLSTMHRPTFYRDQSYLDSKLFADQLHPNQSRDWRLHVSQWCAEQALGVDGDFVECGVDRAYQSGSIIERFDFGRYSDRRFYLIDTFGGLVSNQVTQKDRAAEFNEYSDTYDQVKSSFDQVKNVSVIRGVVPEILPRLEIEKVAYLSIDMNCRAPEVAAFKYFWCRMATGGVVLFDDYGWLGHEHQQVGIDELCAEFGVTPLVLPTGQALVVKPSGFESA